MVASQRSFLVGLLLGSLILSQFWISDAAYAEHLNTGCYPAAWTEAGRENDIRAEDGVHSQMKVNYPSGGPVANGGLVKSIFAERNFDNKIETGWLWRDGLETQPTRFVFRRNQGTPTTTKYGFAGSLNSFHDYKLDNDTGNHWDVYEEGVVIDDFTFVDLNDNILPWVNVEVDNSCDAGSGTHRLLTDKACDSCGYLDWLANENYTVGTDNPCHHGQVISVTRWEAQHGSGPGEICA